jgi:hypothetical protein
MTFIRCNLPCNNFCNLTLPCPVRAGQVLYALQGSTIDLHDVYNLISIIPQDPILPISIIQNYLNTFTAMGPTGGSHFAFHILIPKYVLLKKDSIYHKMQRETLYNLHNKSYFNCVIFVFEESKTLCD